MADEAVRTRYVVEDEASDALDRLRGAFQDASRQIQDTGQAASDTTRDLSQLDQGISDSASLVERLVDILREAGAQGTTFDPLLVDLQSLQAEGYDTSNVTDALAEALSRLEAEASAAATSVDSVADSSHGTESALAGVEQQASATGAAAAEASVELGNVGNVLAEIPTLAGAAGIELGALTRILNAAKMGGPFAALGAGAVFAGGAAAQEEVGVERLVGALERLNITREADIRAVEAQIAARQRLGYADDQLRDSLSLILPLTQDLFDSFRVLDAAMDLSAATGRTLEQSVNIVNQAYLGQSARLKRLGIDLDEGVEGMEAVIAVQGRFAGAAERMANTTESAFSRAGTAWGNLVEQVGEGEIGGVNWSQVGEDIANHLGNAALGVEFLSDKYGELDRSVREATGNMPVAVEEAANDVVGSLGLVVDEAQNTADSLHTAGTDGGEGWGEGVTGGMDALLPEIQSSLDAVLDILDASDTMAAIGEEGGRGYSGAVAFGIAALRAAIAAEVDNNIAEINRLIVTLNEARKQVGLAEIEMQRAINRQYDQLREVGGQSPQEQERDEERRRRTEMQRRRNEEREEAQLDAKERQRGAQESADAYRKIEEDRARAAERAAKKTGSARKAANREAEAAAKKALADQKRLDAAMERELERNAREIERLMEQRERATETLEDIAQRRALEAVTRRVAQAEEDAAQSAEVWRVALENLGTAMRDLQAEEEEAIRRAERLGAIQLWPFRHAVELAEKALADLQRQGETTRSWYEGILQGIDDQLYEVGQREAEIDNRIREVSRYYDQALIPLQRELRELQREEQADQREEELRDLTQTVENLTARLQRAQVGSLEYTRIQEQLAEAQDDLNRKQRQFTVEDQIAALEEAREAELANLQVERELQEEQRRALEQQRQLTERQLELFEREQRAREAGAQAAVTAAEEAEEAERRRVDMQLDAVKREYDERKTALENTIRLTEEQGKKSQVAYDKIAKGAQDAAQGLKDFITQSEIAEQDTKDLAAYAAAFGKSFQDAENALADMTPGAQAFIRDALDPLNAQLDPVQERSLANRWIKAWDYEDPESLGKLYSTSLHNAGLAEHTFVETSKQKWPSWFDMMTGGFESVIGVMDRYAGKVSGLPAPSGAGTGAVGGAGSFIIPAGGGGLVMTRGAGVPYLAPSGVGAGGGVSIETMHFHYSGPAVPDRATMRRAAGAFSQALAERGKAVTR